MISSIDDSDDTLRRLRIACVIATGNVVSARWRRGHGSAEQLQARVIAAEARRRYMAYREREPEQMRLEM